MTIFSGFACFGGQNLKDFTINYLIIVPYALTKFYNFVLMNCLVNIIDYGNIDLLSNSAIISIFLMIYSFISTLIVDIFLNNIVNELFLFQFILGCLVYAIILLFLLLSFISH